MFLVRDIMYCKPGQVRPMVQKFLALDKVGRPMGFPAIRVTTDVCAERYWTVVAEMEVESVDKHAEMVRKSMSRSTERSVNEPSYSSSSLPVIAGSAA